MKRGLRRKRVPVLFGKLAENNCVMRKKILTLLICAGFVAGAQGFKIPLNAPDTSDEILPAEKIEKQNKQVINGEKAFMHYCNSCHPGGKAGLGPSIINKPLPGFLIKFQVRQGFGMMPAFKKEVIPSEKLDDIVEFLKEK